MAGGVVDIFLCFLCSGEQPILAGDGVIVYALY